MFEKQIFQYIFSKKQKDLKDLKDPRTLLFIIHSKTKETDLEMHNHENDHPKEDEEGKEEEKEGACHFSSTSTRAPPLLEFIALPNFFHCAFREMGEGGGTLEIVGKKGDEEWTRRGTRFTSVAGSSSLAGLAPFSEATGEISTITQRGGSKHRPLLSSPPSVAPPPIHKSNNLSGPSAPF